MVGMSTETMTKLPVINFSKEDCMKPGTSSWLSVREEVCQALESLGCFVAIMPDKISPELHDTIFGTLKEIFDSPSELKAKNRYEVYSFVGYESFNPVHEGLGVLNPNNPEETQKFTHIFYPDGNDQFRDGLDLYAKVLLELNNVVTRMVFEHYGVEKYHDDHNQTTHHFFRFAKYKEPNKTGSDVGLLSHTDRNFNTILHQNHVNGLEINTKDDEWIMFDPQQPSSFLFMSCDMFKVWSNDRTQTCRHRVNTKGNDEIRYSLGFFSHKIGVTTTPKELVDEDHPLRYKPIEQLQYVLAARENTGPELTLDTYCAI